MLGEGAKDKSQLMEFWAMEEGEEQKVFEACVKELETSLVPLRKGFTSVRMIPKSILIDLRSAARKVRASLKAE